MNVIECTDAVRNAAARYRAIIRNNEVGTDPWDEQRREWDDRIGEAEAALEREILKAAAMFPDEAIDSMNVVPGGVSVKTDLPRTIFIPLST